uniref:Uncharacterized protein n=1 Tax=Rhizophora mucronata TaxID=61149 RepID=A0A2P2PC46_RHIMU
MRNPNLPYGLPIPNMLIYHVVFTKKKKKRFEREEKFLRSRELRYT